MATIRRCRRGLWPRSSEGWGKPFAVGDGSHGDHGVGYGRCGRSGIGPLPVGRAPRPPFWGRSQAGAPAPRGGESEIAASRLALLAMTALGAPAPRGDEGRDRHGPSGLAMTVIGRACATGREERNFHD